MNSDENRAGRRRPRPLGQPQLPPGPLKDLKDLLYELYLRAGAPTLDEIEAKVYGLADGLAEDLRCRDEDVDKLIGAAPKRDTIARIIGSTQIPPSDQDLLAVAAALARAAGRLPAGATLLDLAGFVEQTRDLWVRARMTPQFPRLGKPVSQHAPLELEVHHAIRLADHDGELDPMPQYVDRAHDTPLRAVVEAAHEGTSRMVMLVGGSSTGKTRSCWEAVKDLPEQWWLWHPIDPSRPAAAARALREVGPHTVVWLNDAQHYLITTDPAVGELVTAQLRVLLTDPSRGPVLVLGSVWPEHWAALTRPPSEGQPDPHSQARELLAGTDIVVAEAFTDAELDTLRDKAGHDPRLQHAADHADHGRITQHLAGVPELLQRYRNAPPAARAVIHTAIDARRLGHPLSIPHALLEQAAPGYLSDHDWNQAADDWLERALTYTAAPCHGTPGPVTRIRPRPGGTSTSGKPCYRLADYLEQAGGIERAEIFPPASVWDAIARTVGDADLLAAIGQQAQERGRYRRAIQFYRLAADHGHIGALWDWADLQAQAGDLAGAEALYWQAADQGNTRALLVLARRHEQAGDLARAQEIYRQAADQGDTDAAVGLADLLWEGGDRAGAEELYRQVADQGDTWALSALALQREEAGDRAGAEDIARQAADVGDTRSLMQVATKRWMDGDPAGAEELYRQAAAQGNGQALRALVKLRDIAGDQASANALILQAYDYGDYRAPGEIAIEREQDGDRHGAETLVLQAFHHGDKLALSMLSDYRQEAGDQADAEALCQQAAELGDDQALSSLRALPADTADEIGAPSEAWHMARVNRGIKWALLGLASSREQAGDPADAERLRRFGLTDDGKPADELE